ncbi:hypothetical protein GCM10010218_32080 [Streptomyces mashuensis]|uniref:Lasso RiPP family leader peptide-containing protein n=1 Tax=Streptomyces mashuensis TaxID=33904 RepID=A0A919B4P1_9ACTN|nr:lasso RiPP family leader peptide-containing protein [Streptomyces mashuensis]GHF48187.1 hypothetical protein GCM10010218_32080 [Streptomyces mashuensis]
MELHETYEPPALVDAGEFTDVTRGYPPGAWMDGSAPYPYYSPFAG